MYSDNFNAMLIIGKTYITYENNCSFLCSDITCGKKRFTLWFSADTADESPLCRGRADAFITAVIIYAMRRGRTIKCAEPVSEKLYFQLTEYLIPMLSKNENPYYPIKIEAPVTSEAYPSAGISGTVNCADISSCTGGHIKYLISHGSAGASESTTVRSNCVGVLSYRRFEAVFLSQAACVLSLQGLLSDCGIILGCGAKVREFLLFDSSFAVFSINCVSTESLSITLLFADNTEQNNRKAIRIGVPYIEEQADGTCLCAEISDDGHKETLWFRVSVEYGKYLTSDRADAFLAALLTTAMRQGKDIICEAPVTEQLLRRINNYLIPLMSANIQYYNRIKVCAAPVKPLSVNAGAVGTGCTCGVDSMLTIMEHTGEQCKCFPLTHLLCVSNGSIEGSQAHDTLKIMTEKMQNGIGAEIGMPVISIDTNLKEAIDENDLFIRAHSFCHTAVILALQKLFRAVLWSSSHSSGQFELNENSDGYYELAVYNCFDTGCTSLYSSGSIYTRMEKLSLLSDYPLAHRFLHPCIYALRENDCTCGKCVRTITGLYCLGTLDRFREVFDVDKFERDKEWYFKNIWDKRHSSYDTYDVLKALRAKGIRIPK